MKVSSETCWERERRILESRYRKACTREHVKLWHKSDDMPRSALKLRISPTSRAFVTFHGIINLQYEISHYAWVRGSSPSPLLWVHFNTTFHGKWKTSREAFEGFAPESQLLEDHKTRLNFIMKRHSWHPWGTVEQHSFLLCVIVWRTSLEQWCRDVGMKLL